MSEASSEFGISQSTIRKRDAEGKLRCVRTPGNTRLIQRQSLLECFGLSVSVENGEQAKRIICYFRVSTRKQNENLLRQIEKVRAFVQEKYQTEPIIFSEIGSDLSDSRKLYLKLIANIIAGEVGKVVCFS
jgi:predicted site-specific integrase-resolvase